VHWLAAAQVAGRPLTVTEWNVQSFPAPDRHSAPLQVAAAASHQGWDALMQYAYAQTRLDGPGRPSNWHAFNDPGLLSTLPAAALLYRQAHVGEATTIYAFVPGKEQLFEQRISPETSVALRTAPELGKLVIALPSAAELPWLAESAVPSGARVIRDPDEALVDRQAAGAVSDTGELRRSWSEGTYVIQTARTQAATGWIGGRRLELPDMVVDLETRHASIVVQSLTGRPIRESSAILISLGTRSMLPSMQELPFHSEALVGRLAIHAPPGLALHSADGGAARVTGARAQYRDGRYLIDFDSDLATHWLMLK